MDNRLEEYTLRNGTVLVSILDYLDDEDFYGRYNIIQETLKRHSPT